MEPVIISISELINLAPEQIKNSGCKCDIEEYLFTLINKTVKDTVNNYLYNHGFPDKINIIFSK